MEKYNQKVLVKCPYSNQTIDIGPFLYDIHHHFDGFSNASDAITDIIEDIAANGTDIIEGTNAQVFCSYIDSLRLLRQGIKWMSRTW